MSLNKNLFHLFLSITGWELSESVLMNFIKAMLPLLVSLMMRRPNRCIRTSVPVSSTPFH
jgi:hypothetical protein